MLFACIIFRIKTLKREIVDSEKTSLKRQKKRSDIANHHMKTRTKKLSKHKYPFHEK